MSIVRRLVLVSWCLGAVTSAHAQCPLQWSAASEAIDGAAVLPGGDLVVIGSFTSIGGVAANRIARLQGTAWQALGAGLNAPASHVVTLPNGDVVAAGAFTTAGSVAAAGLARWDGVAWQAHPGAPLGQVEKLVVLPNGELVVARNVSLSPTNGYVEVARFDGAVWQVIGTSSGSTGLAPFATVADLEVLANGTLVAVGDWAAMNPMGWPGPTGYRELVTWNGASWDYLYDTSSPADLLEARDGDLFLARDASLGGGIHHRSGGAWLGAAGTGLGEVLALAELPNGDVVAAGYQTGQPWQLGCQRWNGVAWTDLGFWTPGAQGWIGRLFLHEASGRLFAGGSFAAAGGSPAAGRAWLTTPCLPATVTTPTACVGPAGPLTTLQRGLPWTGGVLRTTTLGFVPSAVAVVVLGASPASLPLAGLLPTLSTGCDVLVVPDVLLLAFPVGGEVDVAIAVPDVPALAGAVVYQQTGQLDLGAGGIVSASVGQRLAMTLGTF